MRFSGHMYHNLLYVLTLTTEKTHVFGTVLEPSNPWQPLTLSLLQKPPPSYKSTKALLTRLSQPFRPHTVSHDILQVCEVDAYHYINDIRGSYNKIIQCSVIFVFQNSSPSCGKEGDKLVPCLNEGMALFKFWVAVTWESTSHNKIFI